MLTELFIASIGVPEKPPSTNAAKDAAIFHHEFQPLAAQRAVFKKSATPQNCLAVSEDHVFAAQSDKAVVHVYNREKGNQEAIVPFTERIICLALACDDTVLVLGTTEGRIFLWETCTGRQITTAQSHLQAVTVLAVDPTSNFLLSASADSTTHVWSIPALLSFSNAGPEPLAPLTTFTSHRAEIKALVLGHSSSFCNIAVTASNDKICLVWDYHTNTVLRTFLLPAVPRCLALDAADRAVYVGYEDGSVQRLELHTSPESGNTQIGSLHGVQDGAKPVQPSSTSRWQSSDALIGAALCMSLSFDSCTLLSGHQSGAVLAWDVASGRVNANVLQAPLPGPVTNLSFLPVAGFASDSKRNLKVQNIVKPKFGAFGNAEGTVPGSYSLSVQLNSDLHAGPSAFQQVLFAPSFPQSLIDEGLSELASSGKGPAATANGDTAQGSDDFMALDDEPEKPRQATLEEQNAYLRAQLDALRRLQSASFDKIDKINVERKALLQREQKRMAKQGGGRPNGIARRGKETDFSSDDD